MPASALMFVSSTFMSFSGASTVSAVNGSRSASSRAKIALARSSRSRSRASRISAVTGVGDAAAVFSTGGSLPGLLEHRHELGVLVLAREIGRRLAAREAHVRLGTGGEEGLEDVAVAVLRRLVQRRERVLLRRVHV